MKNIKLKNFEIREIRYIKTLILFQNRKNLKKVQPNRKKKLKYFNLF